MGATVSCGLPRSGSPTCWHEGRLVTSLPKGELRKLSIGRNHACGIDPSGEVQCWGLSKGGYTFPAGRFVDVAAGEGSSITCALTPKGSATCRGVAAAPSGVAFRQVDVGGLAVCGVTTTGDVRCWGTLRYETTPSVPKGGGARVPVVMTPPTLSGVQQVALGRDHGCARIAGGTVACWGLDDAGQASPPRGAKFMSIDAFGARTCGVTDAREVLCWGTEVSWRTRTFAPPAGPFIEVRVGAGHVCGLTPEKTIVCWGVDQQGQVSGQTDLIRN